MNSMYFVVYCIVDNFGVLQYIGCSSNPWHRERTHKRDQRFSWMKFKVLQEFQGAGAAYATERQLIKNLRPKLNKSTPPVDRSVDNSIEPVDRTAGREFYSHSSTGNPQDAIGEKFKSS